MELSLRPAKSSDLPDLGRIARASKAFWGYPPELIEGWNQELSISEQQLAQWQIVVAQDAAGRSLGFFALSTSSLRVATLEHLWVVPDSIGRGVGSLLLQRAIEKAREAGAESIEIDSDPHAERFYRERGAMRVAEIPAPIPQEPKRFLPRMTLNISQANQTPNT